MNVIIANQYANQLKTIDSNAKAFVGLYDVNEVGNSFRTFKYDFMILDVTSLKRYNDVNTIKQLTNYINPSTLILLLDNACLNDEYLSGLVKMGVYNFAKDLPSLSELMGKPNTFNNVAGYQVSQAVNEYSSDSLNVSQKRNCKVIGFDDVTRHAGATTLINILVKTLKKKYNVIGVEVDSTDFAFFKNKNLQSTISNKIRYFVDKNSSVDVIFVDINGSDKAKDICDEIIYLVEPTTIKINKLVLAKPTIFQELFDKKVVLNKCCLNKWEVAEFENEARIKIYYALPPVNERGDRNKDICNFLSKLGFKV